MELDMLDLQTRLRKHGVLINFSGRFTQEIIEELGDAVKMYLETETTITRKHTFNVFSVFIEQTQNIKNYSMRSRDVETKEEIANSGIVAIGKKDSAYFVYSGNIIENKDIEPLCAKLDRISTLDKEGLKKLYKDQMKNALMPGSSGAGLGLIDMARRAIRPPIYSVAKVDEDKSFFTLKIYV